MVSMTLTATQEDYIESLFRRAKVGGKGARVTDLAEDLGCRLPTVTRTVQVLVEKGYFHHEARGLVSLTERGEAIAHDLAHRHDDAVAFLELILGLDHESAVMDACRLEHSLSKTAAARLHIFMNYIEALPARERQQLRKAVKDGAATEDVFAHLVDVKTPGWRG